MLRRMLPGLALPFVLAAAGPALAAPPPSGARPLSDILRTLEQGGQVAYFDEIEWEDDHWEIDYVTRDGSKRKVRVNPMTGEVTPR